MRCPICGKELRRSQKDPNYGLCDNCRKKFKWKEDYFDRTTTAKKKSTTARVPTRVQSNAPRNQRVSPPQNIFQTGRLVIGIVSIVLFFLVTLQSCAAGLGNTLSQTGELSGSAGFLLSICLLIAGIITLCLRKRRSSTAFAIPAIFYLIGAILAAANVGSYSDLQIWAIVSAFFGALHLFFMFKANGTSAIISIIVPIIIVAVIVAFSIISKGSKNDDTTKTNKKTENQKSSPEEPNISPTESDSQAVASEDTDDGIIDFTCDNFTIKYTTHEVSSDYDGSQCLIVYFDYTNTSSEATSASLASSTKAFQNGVECEYAILDYQSNEADQNLYTEVQPGTTINVAYVYKINDLTEVQLELSELWDFDEKTDTMTLSLQ